MEYMLGGAKFICQGQVSLCTLTNLQVDMHNSFVSNARHFFFLDVRVCLLVVMKLPVCGKYIYYFVLLLLSRIHKYACTGKVNTVTNNCFIAANNLKKEILK